MVAIVIIIKAINYHLEKVQSQKKSRELSKRAKADIRAQTQSWESHNQREEASTPSSSACKCYGIGSVLSTGETIRKKPRDMVPALMWLTGY